MAPDDQIDAAFHLLVFDMPRFFLDVIRDQQVFPDPGGLLFQDDDGARVAADKLARHLASFTADFTGRRSYVRVRDERGSEFYRSPIDVLPNAGPIIEDGA